MTIIDQDKEVLIEFVMLSRLTTQSIILPIRNKMTKRLENGQPKVLRELRYKTTTFLAYFSYKNKQQQQQKKKLKLGKGLAKHFKIILPKQIKNRHVDHLFQEWFYTGVSQYKFGFILQDRIRS